ncbi:MAG: hypothetical protein Q7Q71_15455 [Verrucomicrobiota bacterium JB023]|nr:hypothetical protein [Verrucomicrobiota bacterium JB023]
MEDFLGSAADFFLWKGPVGGERFLNFRSQLLHEGEIMGVERILERGEGRDDELMDGGHASATADDEVGPN